MKYIVKNIYGIQGETTHRTPEAACRAANKREGDGWVVEDNEGRRYTIYDGRAASFASILAATSKEIESQGEPI